MRILTWMILLCCAVLHGTTGLAGAGVTTTLPQSTTTSSTTTTTLTFPDLPACADFNDDDRISASDAQGVLQAAVGTRLCGVCVCDVDNSGTIVASDALTVLRTAVGQTIALACPAGGNPLQWDGGGDGTLWEDAANWEGDRVPDPCEIAVIESDLLSAAPTGEEEDTVVRHQSGTHGALGIISTAELVLAAGSMTVTGPIYVENRLEIQNTTLAAARIAPAPGGSVLVTGRPTFDMVTLDAFVTAGQIDVHNGLTINGVLQFGQNSGMFVHGSGEQAIDGAGEIRLLGNGISAFVLADSADTVVHFGPDLGIVGSHGNLGGAVGSFIVDGPIEPASGFGLTVAGADWTYNGETTATSGLLTFAGPGVNTGSVAATGSSTVVFDGQWLNTGEVSAVDATLRLGKNSLSWENDGTISVENSTVDLNGNLSLAKLGSFSRDGGTVLVKGTFDNSADLVLDDDRGTWTLAGGSIVGGTITATPGHQLTVTSGTLDGVTLDTPLAVSMATFLNGTVLNEAATTVVGGSVRVDGGGEQTLAGTGSVELVHGGFPGSVTSDASTLTIAPGMRVHGATGTVGALALNLLVNQGTIESDGGGNALVAAAVSGTNEGSLIATQTDLRLRGTWTNSGSMTSRAGRTILSDNPVTLAPAGSLEVEIASLASFGDLIGSSSVALGGMLTVTLVNDFEPAIGNTFRVVSGATVSGTFDSVQGLAIGNGKVFQENYDATGLTLEVVAE